MGVECGGDTSDQKLCAIVDAEPVAVHGHGAIREQFREPWFVDDRRPRVAAMSSGYFGQVDGHIAHQPLDEVGPEPVVLRELIALDGSELAFRDLLEIVARPDGVLDGTLRHPTDGAGAETDQCFGAIVGIALKFRRSRPSRFAAARLSSGSAKWSKPTRT